MILPSLPDEESRNDAVRERDRNVVVDAGAGTGKTELLVRRFVEMVAPFHGGEPCRVDRVGAVTFTRRAAGELAFRIRQRLLADLSLETNTLRCSQLRLGLADLDRAPVGTIHSFCDRLLRRHAFDARLPASYEVVEDTTGLVRETVDVLIHGTREGSLARTLQGLDASLIEEAAETLRDLPRCGLLLETVELPKYEKFGLDALVEGFLRTRDVTPVIPPFQEFEPTTFRQYAREFLERVEPIAHLEGPGIVLLRRMAETFRRVERQEDPVVLFGEIARPLGRREPLGRTARRADVADDDLAWTTWQAIFGSTRRTPPRDPPLRDDLLAPLRSWLSSRLVRLQPVVIAAYESVKRRRRCLDPLDLLLKLRDLLRENKNARAALQQTFDHLLVDEFQDTDPLQAEILLYLGEDGAVADDWKNVRLRPGRLTVVGDPKQSVYRFRRADIHMYAEVTRRLEEQGAARFTLSANLRTDPALVAWLNHRFLDILRPPPGNGVRFEPATGRAFHQELTVGRAAAATTPRVHVVPIAPEEVGAGGFRELEAVALANYVRWLVEESGEEIPISATERRRVRYGDIAVLAVVTTNVGMLVPAFDAHGVPYSIAGGRLFLQDELHRRFLLGLRALADRDDGVAEAALLRPPFFALDAADVLRERAFRRAEREGESSPEESESFTLPEPGTEAAPRGTPLASFVEEGQAAASIERAQEAVALVAELRRRRLDRPPGETARDLLERTAIGRLTALGANGHQRMAGLREICFALERIAARERVDYDGASARLRDWVERPIQFDPPPPVGQDAVRILTVHQAKGLEFPVVVLWDCRGTMRPRNDRPPWLVSRDGDAWLLGLDGLWWEEPRGAEISAREREYQLTERERLTYVAATRARDLLVVPCDGSPYEAVPGSEGANRRLLRDSPAGSLFLAEPFLHDGPPAWERPLPMTPSTVIDAASGTGLDDWNAAVVHAQRPHLAPRAVSVLAWETTGRAAPDEGWADNSLLKGDDAKEAAPRRSRYGSRFGNTVHRAIGLAIRDRLDPQEAVRRAVGRTELAKNHSEAAADVTRALEALRREGIPGKNTTLRFEYPVSAPTPSGESLIVGNIDLVAAGGTEWLLLDFKTDAIDGDSLESEFTAYLEQLRHYGRLLEAQLPASILLRLGLLFTEDGGIRWIPHA